MIAAMRPSHAHSTAPSVHSRPSSRNSSHTISSTVASPSAQSKTDKLAAKASSNVASGVSGKKASAAKKAAKSQQQTANTIDKPAPVPGLITLTKPMTEEIQSSKQQQQPAGSSKAKKAKEAKFAAADEASSSPIKASRSKKSKSSPKADTSEMLLSKSAPSATLSHVQQPGQNKQPGNGVEQASGLTWQQEMFKNASKSNVDLAHQGNGSKRHNKKSNQTKHDGNLALGQKVVQDGRDSPALTWQQELLGAKKRTGPHFDVFADARDVETFGADDGSAQGHGPAHGKAGKRRPRAGSFGSGAAQKNGKGAGKGRGNDVPLHIDDLFESVKADGMAKSNSAQSQSQRNAGASGNAAHLYTQYPSHGAPIHIAPSTPVKKANSNNAANQQHPAVAAAIAYAGPNFHNSPSPASLPAPKFQNRLSKNSSELERGTMRPSSLALGSSGESGGSDDDEGEQLTRGVRGTTAPAELTSTPSKAPAPAAVPSHNTAAAESPAPKPSMQPGATVESLLARMLGGARLN
ncbi:uncharacterized protein SRS1_14291 [Sporisorium reilianum f. sp. reilianum]|uniref:Uncharacterized protein n=1 Tax=Sporisorium reilianum f. sp. reilianum TaxID=72559 RepID=A0A2N8UEW7_9BASI|nr:uncharacterized protein SRS1_14291 [Sporisorium reilianum f. sp. reilianum]